MKNLVFLISFLFFLSPSAKAINIILGPGVGFDNLSSKNVSLVLSGLVEINNSILIGGKKYISSNNSQYSATEMFDLMIQMDFLRVGGFYGYYTSNIAEFLNSLAVSTDNAQYGASLGIIGKLGSSMNLNFESRFHKWAKSINGNTYFSTSLSIEFIL